ncbi:ABC transporter permease [Streptomyces sp. NPDC087420]|uniref:ABC transporter permease n=1 Tax=Streptomyces sp. NPDC087420 TaxID=3365785 RepID=UPI003837574A
MSTLAPRGPLWVAARLHRSTLWTGAGLLVLAVAWLLYQRLHSVSVIDGFPATGCSIRMTTPACHDAIRSYSNAQMTFQAWLSHLGLFLLVLPGVVGGFVAGPVIARELESGTYKLAWSQSVTPTRWFASKLAVPLVCTVAGVSLLLGLYRWAWTTGPDDAHYADFWYGAYRNIGLGPAALGYALLGIALGALLGLLIRRTVIAMSATALAVGAVVLALHVQLRPYLWPALTDTTPIGRAGSAWVVQQGVITAGGQRITWEDCLGYGRRVSPCEKLPEGAVYYIDYHPASHLWPLQLVETGIVLALAAAAALVAFRVLRRLHA